MDEQVNGYDDGYRQVPVPNPRRMSREYLEGYVTGVRDQLTPSEYPALAGPKEG